MTSLLPLTLDQLPACLVNQILGHLSFKEKFIIISKVSKLWQKIFLEYLAFNTQEEPRIILGKYRNLNPLLKSYPRTLNFHTFSSSPCLVTSAAFTEKGFYSAFIDDDEKMKVLQKKLIVRDYILTNNLTLTLKDKVSNFCLKQLIDSIATHNAFTISFYDPKWIYDKVNWIKFDCNSHGKIVDSSNGLHRFSFLVKHFYIQGKEHKYLSWEVSNRTELTKNTTFTELLKWVVVSETAKLCAVNLNLKIDFQSF